MNKQQMIKDMRSFVGGSYFINKSQVRKFTGKGIEGCNALLDGLDYAIVSRKKSYYIKDVAERIMEGVVKS